MSVVQTQPQAGQLRRIALCPAVQLAAVLWVIANVAVILLAGGTLIGKEFGIR